MHPQQRSARLTGQQSEKCTAAGIPVESLRHVATRGGATRREIISLEQEERCLRQ
jgi:hypothetical protein